MMIHRALLGTLAAGAYISIHSDRGQYFRERVRIHYIIRSTPKVRVYGANLFYEMKPGEVWALRNLAEHGAMNDEPELTRLHLISDYDQTPELIQMLADGERDLGVEDPDALWHLHQYSRKARKDYPSTDTWYETQQFFQDAKRTVTLGLGRMLHRAG